MGIFSPGDVVRVPFPYTDRATRQHRPALIVSNGAIGENAGLLWVAMITSAENRAWPDDHPIADTSQAGLPAPSVIRPCKIATIEARRAERVGRVEPETLSAIKSVLIRYIGLAVPPAARI